MIEIDDPPALEVFGANYETQKWQQMEKEMAQHHSVVESDDFGALLIQARQDATVTIRQITELKARITAMANDLKSRSNVPTRSSKTTKRLNDHAETLQLLLTEALQLLKGERLKARLALTEFKRCFRAQITLFSQGKVGSDTQFSFEEERRLKTEVKATLREAISDLYRVLTTSLTETSATGFETMRLYRELQRTHRFGNTLMENARSNQREVKARAKIKQLKQEINKNVNRDDTYSGGWHGLQNIIKEVHKKTGVKLEPRIVNYRLNKWVAGAGPITIERHQSDHEPWRLTTDEFRLVVKELCKIARKQQRKETARTGRKT